MAIYGLCRCFRPAISVRAYDKPVNLLMLLSLSRARGRDASADDFAGYSII